MFYLVESMASRTKDFTVLAGVHGSKVSAGFTKVLTWVEPVWVFCEALTNSAGHDHTAIGIDVDLANCGFRGFTKLVFWDTDCIWHLATIFVDHLDIILWDGGGTVKNDWETWELLLDFVKDIEADFWFGARWELVSAVGSTDGNSKGVDAGLADEVLNFFWAGVGVLFSLDIIFNACENAEFTFDCNIVWLGVGEFANLLGEGNVVFVGKAGAIDHD